MFTNTKRTARAIKKIVSDRRRHKQRMNDSKKIEQFMLRAVDNAFSEIRNDY